MRESDRVGGSGSLNHEKARSTWTYPQLARLMIVKSDNVASNRLLRRLGIDRLNGRARKLGLSATRFERPFVDQEARRAGREYWTTARDMGRLLRLIYRKEILTPAVCDEMILLLEGTSRGRIATGVPRWIPVGHKGGRLAGLRADIGWIRLVEISIDAVVPRRRHEQRTAGADHLQADLLRFGVGQRIAVVKHARPPVAEHNGQVGRPHLVVAVEVGIATRARSPVTQQHGQITGADTRSPVQLACTRRRTRSRTSTASRW